MSKCEVCGEPMPDGEQMFKFHGYSGPCPAPPLSRAPSRAELIETALRRMRNAYVALSTKLSEAEEKFGIDFDEVLEVEWVEATAAQLNADAALGSATAPSRLESGAGET